MPVPSLDLFPDASTLPKTLAGLGRMARLLWLSLLFLTASSWAIDAPLPPTTSNGGVSVRGTSGAALFPEVAVLVDAPGTETIESVTSTGESRFSPLPHPLSAGYTRKVHWLRIVLRREAATPVHWLFEVGPGFLDDVRLYTPDSSSPTGFREHAGGDRLPFAAREEEHRNFVFHVDLPDGSAPCTLYLRLQTTSTSMTHLTLWEPGAFTAETQGEYLVLGLLLGTQYLMLLYSAAYLYFLRERYLLLFIGIVSSMLIAYFGNNGLAAQFLFPTHPALANLFSPIGTCLSTLFGVWFFFDFLKIPQRYPWLGKFNTATMLLSVIALPGVFFDYYVEIAPVMMGCSLIGLPFCIVAAWRSINLDIIGSRWVALAYVWYGLIIAANLLSILGFIPSHKFMLYGWQYGAPIYVIFLMWGVLRRVQEIKRRHDHAVASSIAAEMKAELANAQREEKSRFLSLMAHELKTPLATIDVAVQALGYMPAPVDQAISRRHQRIRDAVARLNSLLEDSLNVVRDETGMSNPMSGREHFAMEDLLKELGAAYATHQARLHFEWEEIDGCYGNVMLLRRALGNLLDNALKYGQAGEAIGLSVCRRSYMNQPGVAFEVTSAFAGEDEEDCEAWFGKYWRGKNSEGKEGLGLGLYLVRSIAEAHGGNAYCSLYRDGGGAAALRLIVTLWIPIRDDERTT